MWFVTDQTTLLHPLPPPQQWTWGCGHLFPAQEWTIFTPVHRRSSSCHAMRMLTCGVVTAMLSAFERVTSLFIRFHTRVWRLAHSKKLSLVTLIILFCMPSKPPCSMLIGTKMTKRCLHEIQLGSLKVGSAINKKGGEGTWKHIQEEHNKTCFQTESYTFWQASRFERLDKSGHYLHYFTVSVLIKIK